MPTELIRYKRQILQAVGLLVIGFLGFSIADLCAKILQNHYSVYQVLAVSGGIGVIISGGWVLVRHGVKSFFPEKLKLHLLRGLIISGTAFFMVSALKTLPLADFYGVAFLAPFLMLIMSVMFLNEHVGWRRWLAVCVGFSGVIVLAGPQFDHLGIGFVYAILGALFAATSVIVLRKIGHGAPIPLYGFYPSLCIFITNLIAMLATDSYVPFQHEDLIWFSLHGPVATMGVLCTSMGYAKSPEASIVAPFMYTQIIWGILFGWIFFAVVPIDTTMIGLTMVIGAGCYSIWRDYKNAHDKHKIVPDFT